MKPPDGPRQPGQPIHRSLPCRTGRSSWERADWHGDRSGRRCGLLVDAGDGELLWPVPLQEEEDPPSDECVREEHGERLADAVATEVDGVAQEVVAVPGWQERPEVVPERWQVGDAVRSAGGGVAELYEENHRDEDP